MKNYYDLLGIKNDANIEDIKKAYKKLSKKFHPDLNDNDDFFKERFQDIQEAYEILSNVEKRRKYDKELFAEQTVNEEIPLPEVSLKVNKRDIQVGEKVIFKWETLNINKIEIISNGNKTTRYNSNDEIYYSPQNNTSFIFIFYGIKESVTKNVNIQVSKKTEIIQASQKEEQTQKTEQIQKNETKPQKNKTIKFLRSLFLSIGLFLILFFYVTPWVYNLFDIQFSNGANWWSSGFFSVLFFLEEL